MQMHRYQIYLVLFFLFFLSTDAALIYVANKTYEGRILLSSPKKAQVKNALQKDVIDAVLSSHFEINIKSGMGREHVINIKPKSNGLRSLLVQVMNAEDKKDVKIFQPDYPYEIAVNLVPHSRWTLRIHAQDQSGHDYFSSFRLLVSDDRCEFVQLS